MKMQDNKQQSLTSGKSEGMSSQGNGSQKKRSFAVSFNKPANQAQNKISAVQQFRQKKPSIEIRRRDSKADEKEQVKMMKAKIQTSPLVDPEPTTPVDDKYLPKKRGRKPMALDKYKRESEAKIQKLQKKIEQETDEKEKRKLKMQITAQLDRLAQKNNEQGLQHQVENYQTKLKSLFQIIDTRVRGNDRQAVIDDLQKACRGSYSLKKDQGGKDKLMDMLNQFVNNE